MGNQSAKPRFSQVLEEMARASDSPEGRRPYVGTTAISVSGTAGLMSRNQGSVRAHLVDGERKLRLISVARGPLERTFPRRRPLSIDFRGCPEIGSVLRMGQRKRGLLVLLNSLPAAIPQSSQALT
jgi:hypothetical protein